MVESIYTSELNKSEFMFQLCYWLAVQGWTGHVTLFILDFFIYKNSQIIKCNDICKILSTVPTDSEKCKFQLPFIWPYIRFYPYRKFSVSDILSYNISFYNHSFFYPLVYLLYLLSKVIQTFNLSIFIFSSNLLNPFSTYFPPSTGHSSTSKCFLPLVVCFRYCWNWFYIYHLT